MQQFESMPEVESCPLLCKRFFPSFSRPGSGAELCLPLFAITRSLVCSSAVFRGAGRGAADDELLLLVVVLAAGSAGSLAGAGSASALSGSGALGGIFPTVSLDSATLGTRSMSLAGSSPIRERSRISGTLHSSVLNVLSLIHI